jgi:hypothetical protein
MRGVSASATRLSSRSTSATGSRPRNMVKWIKVGLQHAYCSFAYSAPNCISTKRHDPLTLFQRIRVPTFEKIIFTEADSG